MPKYKRVWSETRNCPNCNADYLALQPFQKYCSKSCGEVARRRELLGFARGETLHLCPQCNLPFSPSVRRQQYCSRSCRSSANRALLISPEKLMNTGVTGAVSELLVSADLFRNGFYVFRALSQSSPCDLIALKDGFCLKIEVSTAWQSKSTEKVYSAKKKVSDLYDVLALVLPPNAAVFYQPTITEALINARAKAARSA